MADGVGSFDSPGEAARDAMALCGICFERRGRRDLRREENEKEVQIYIEANFVLFVNYFI